MDVPRVGRLVPGAEDVTSVGDDEYRGRIRVRIGPIALALDGLVRVVELDASAYSAAMSVEAADDRVGGAVRARLSMRLAGRDDGATDLAIQTDAQVLGRLGDFGQPIIKRKTNQIVDEFVANLAGELESGATPT
jgi:carbon monoxide dehydrogenase subunit G